MRIVVVWPEGTHPELRAELEALSPRLRAERLRTLATIGLFIARGHVTPTGVSSVSSIHPETQIKETQRSPALLQLMGKLKDSLS
jgi:hypothetical protein